MQGRALELRAAQLMIRQAVKLARLGLAEQVAPASPAAQTPMRDLSQRYHQDHLKRAGFMFFVRRISNVCYLMVKHVFATRPVGYDP
jgi:hypothetical protein